MRALFSHIRTPTAHWRWRRIIYYGMAEVFGREGLQTHEYLAAINGSSPIAPTLAKRKLVNPCKWLLEFIPLLIAQFFDSFVSGSPETQKYILLL